MKQTVVVHGNCQGEMLAGILSRHQGFAARYECLQFTNYIKEHVPPEVMARCSVFLYQHLGAKWGELSSERLLALAPRDCLPLAVPNMFMRMYWPMYKTTQDGRMHEMLLDDLLERGLSRREAMMLAGSPAPLQRYDLDALLERSLAHERGKEAMTPIKYVDMMLEKGRSERLFYTVNHPGEFLLRFVADEVLVRLDLAPLSSGPLGLDKYYTCFDQPIHPAVAAHFGLAFADAQTSFNVYGVPMTWAQYAGVYAEYAASGIPSFIDYMGAAFGATTPGAGKDAAAQQMPD